jgi:uncharacterized protein YkwD
MAAEGGMRALVLVWALLWPGLVAAQCVVPGNGAALAQGIGQGVNAARQAAGLRPLTVEVQLAAAAQRHACDMARTGSTGHRGSDGTNSHARVEATGFRTCLTAENIAWGFPDPSTVVTGWMNSPGHRSNLLHERVSAMGVGVAQSGQGPAWVLVLSRAC